MKKTIILVDDEVHVRQVMALKLGRAGYRVLTASNGEEALHVAREHPPDLLVSDMQMPLMDGLELCRALAGNASTAGIPVIMVTSREFEIGPDQTRGTNVKLVMSKPFSPAALVKTIAELFQQLSTIAPAAAPARN